ncbi:hypothetical protein [Natrialba taiwanensis]|uniref:Polyprenyl synthetase n=1 Tax=Natrialba taiwanensis DSM 12281 TaxID=1230458 RepID=M0A5I2_9EURY|nr:hypothetical protein [Natrialba taiwanensis]ELY92603.1 Polyprenyl synthetase [Natrialba taiwanensis DSM 12281]
MVEHKTGALFDLCLELPQTLTDTDLGIDRYSALWPAFQIRDDLYRQFREIALTAAVYNVEQAVKQ